MKLHYELEPSEFEVESPLDWQTPEERGAWFVMTHNRYNLPNELGVDFDGYENWKELVEGEAKTLQVYKFVRWYEHRGVAVSLRDEPDGQDWDAGIVGVIFGNSAKEIELAFEQWKPYAEGDIWDIIIKDEHDGVLDSVCGYYGYEAAKAAAQEILQEAQAEQDEKDKLERQAQKEVRQAKTLAKKHGYILAKEV